MTIRFAAAWGGSTPVIVRALCLSASLDAVNDNDRARRLSLCATAAPARYSMASEHLLIEALRHFGRHGLAAAAQARVQAETAHATGDAEGRNHWIAICRQLDRRMGEACARRLSGTA